MGLIVAVFYLLKGVKGVPKRPFTAKTTKKGQNDQIRPKAAKTTIFGHLTPASPKEGAEGEVDLFCTILYQQICYQFVARLCCLGQRCFAIGVFGINIRLVIQ